MTRLGKNQLDFLASMASVHTLLVVPSKMSDALVRRGLMISHSETSDGFLGLTPDGYRAVADAMDAGLIVRPPLSTIIKRQPK